MADVAVVGAGVNGLAAAWALAREGRDVVVYEQFAAGHVRGSSHGRSRIFRLAYPEEEWVRLAQEALAGWRELEAESGETLLGFPGIVELVDDLETSSLGALAAQGVETEVLDRDELLRRFDLRAHEGFVGMLQPEAGYVLADRALAAFEAGIERRGGSVLYESPVASLDAVEAKAVVRHRRSLGQDGCSPRPAIDLQVVETRETVLFFRLERETPVPSTVTMVDNLHGFYSVYDPVYGLKVGHHKSGIPADPDEEGGPDQAIVDEVTEWAGRTFTLAQPEPVDVQTCFYTNTADDSFVLERHGRIVVGSACSGHAFKFGPAVGKRLADLAQEATS